MRGSAPNRHVNVVIIRKVTFKTSQKTSFKAPFELYEIMQLNIKSGGMARVQKNCYPQYSGIGWLACLPNKT